MERDLLSLSMFLLAAVTGAARFRSHKVLDDLSLGVSIAASYAGTLLLVTTLFSSKPPVALVPLSLLILMHATAFCYKNHLPQIFGLPLVIGEVLLALVFTDIGEWMASPVFMLAAWIFHTAFVALGLRLLIHLPPVAMRYGSSWNPYELASKFKAQLPSTLTPTEFS